MYYHVLIEFNKIIINKDNNYSLISTKKPELVKS